MMNETIRKSLQKEVHDLAKGTAGAFIFGLPLLYTMEVWSEGQSLAPEFHLTFLFIMIVANMLLVYIAGFHKKWNKTIFDTFMESISSCGLGIILSCAILWLIGSIEEINFGNVGVILLEGLMMSLGISFANFKFNSSQDERTGFKLPQGIMQKLNPRKTLLQELSASIAGALIFSLNVAPTEEVALIAARLSPLKLSLLFMTELLLCFLILAVVGNKSDYIFRGFFQRPIVHALHTLTASLVVSIVLVAALGYMRPDVHDHHFLSMVVVISLPGVIGASAGRLIL